jgi:hypothetical protein
MKELTRNEMAIVKRTAKSTKQLRDKKARLLTKVAEIEAELASIEESIEIFEKPIKHLTGGFTSEEVLNGTMEVAASMENSSEGEVEETTVEEHEVPVEEAVTIDPNVQSPLEDNTQEDVFGNNECGTNYDAVPFANENND